MTHQDWTIRNENGVAVIRVEGEDYVEVPGTSQKYPAAYPDSVRNTVLETDGDRIRVVLGQIRYMVEGDDINEVKTDAQTTWLQKITANVTPVESDTNVESDKKDEGEGFITG